MYGYCARLGTTLQVRPEQWPPDREAFHRYWEEHVARIEMDERTRRYLQGIAEADFLGKPWSWILGPVRRFPFNLYLWDTRLRIRFGRPIV